MDRRQAKSGSAWGYARCVLQTLLGSFALALFMSGLAAAEEVRVLRLLTYASERPSEELKKMDPVRKALELGLNRRAGVRYQVSMRIHGNYEEALRAVENDEADVARLGPVNYVLAKAANPRLQLVVSELQGGDKSFDGVIFVRNDSGIKRLADLKGKTFAFVERHSTSGGYLAKEALMKAGVNGRGLAAHDYLGRHDKVVFAVAGGLFDAGASNENTFAKYAAEKGLREVARFASPTHAWVARPGLDSALVAQIKDILARTESGTLSGLDRNGFVAGRDGDYDTLRRAMKAVERFEELP